MKTYEGSGHIAPRTLNLSSSWRRVTEVTRPPVILYNRTPSQDTVGKLLLYQVVCNQGGHAVA